MRLKASLTADFEAKYGSLIENISNEMSGVKEVCSSIVETNSKLLSHHWKLLTQFNMVC